MTATDQPQSPPTPTAPAASSLHLVIETLTNATLFQNVLKNVAPKLHAGDLVLIYHQAPSSPPDPAEFNQLAAELKPHLPVGVQLVGSAGQIPNVKILAAGLSKDFWAIAADYEPGGATGGGDYSTAALLAYFGQVASICRAAGFQAIAYPTGHPILHTPAEPWDYGAVAELVDGIWVETQEYAIDAIKTPAIWRYALNKLIVQLAQHGQTLSKLGVQVTLGNDGHGTGTDPATALAAAKVVAANGIPNLYIWTAIGAEAELATLLASLGR